MSEMFKMIKKQNGEAFAQALRNYHNGLLEIPDLDRILRYAGRDAAPLLPYLMSKLAANDDVPKEAPKIEDPFVLLERAGYDAFYADTLEKQNSIKGHFQPGELLCTFNDAARYQEYYIIHAVKKNVQDIKRGDFTGKEQRQDDYGTSVISIQILKKGGFISIKNRYNHAVANCDNTFGSNPDYIIQGLSAALKHKFNIDFSATENSLPDDYVLINDQIVKYNTELRNIYYGDGFWVQNGVVHEFNRAAGDAMFDHFIFDNKTKTLRKIDPNLRESFADDFNRDYGGNKGLYIKGGNLMLGDDVLIGAEQSRIKTLFLPAFQTMSDCCLRNTTALTEFNAPALQAMAGECLHHANSLTEFNAPVLQSMGHDCLYNASALTQFTAPALRSMGDRCLQYAHALKEFTAPALQTMGDHCLYDAPALTQFSAPALQRMGYACLNNAPNLTEFTAPALKTLGRQCLWRLTALTKFTAPALQTMGDHCLYDAPALTQFTAPALQTMGVGCLANATALTQFAAPALQTMGVGCLRDARVLQKCDIGALQSVPAHLTSFAQKLERQKPALYPI